MGPMTDTAATAAHDQAEVIAFLADPATYPARPGSVGRMETHGALVFLAGDEVWKIKRAVSFPYMDFSTLEKRRAVCMREIEVNRLWAPELYLGCVPITRERDGRLALGGSGRPVEWAVRMRRFAQSDLVGNIAAGQGIGSDLARSLADAVLDSHAKAPRIADPRGAARVERLVESVSRNIGDMPALASGGAAASFGARAREQLARAAAVLDRRAVQGFVRRCHGDLHLDNIVLWQGRPLLFDAIEFDEEIATIDTLYDLAFLLMDLGHRRLGAAANIVLNRYLWRSQQDLDLDGLAALPLFLGLRAGVRALVAAERAQQEQAVPGDQDAAARRTAAARSYLRDALASLDPPPPELIAVGGLSGTGKSTLAARLAPGIGASPGAVHLRSDLERKSLLGRGETERLGPEGYTEATTTRVYERLIEKAGRALTAGHAVVVDAIFGTPAERELLAALGAKAGVPLRALWLTAPPATMMGRVAERRGDASDATVDVVRMQLGYETGPLSAAWHIIDAGGPLETTVREARAALSG